MKTQIKKAKQTAEKVKEDLLDQRILAIASKRYHRLQKQIVDSAVKLTEEQDLVVRLGDRILQKAKTVRASLKKNRREEKQK
ncbi:MAG: hypothetical protein H6626_06160 [Pseudobdellovibrionaceae bacterium]|nr:hypothetical protein [Bdellovibrionales bacterium]USN48674.1 MAG: hypothetical protein H6626_06160 [Pseudobdellovibrionaceae bacterium]